MPNKSNNNTVIPEFNSDNEEQEFWATHDSTEYVDWNKAIMVLFPNLKPTAMLAPTVEL